MQSFSWPVLSQEELREQQKYLRPGEYQFQVIKCEHKSSKSGNPMFELTLKIWDATGSDYTARDWLLLTEDAIFKIKRFWQCVGKPEMYEKGNCTEKDFVDQVGHCKTDVKPSDDGEQMFVRIVSYIKPLDDKVVVKPSNISPALEDFVEDDISF
jgi:Protein of unknown function (DUF669)